MNKKKAKLKFVPYSENKYYSVEESFPYSKEEDITNWNIDEKYQEYSEKLYPQAKLSKEEYGKYVKSAIGFQRIGRKLTAREARYLNELWRAIEPSKPYLHLIAIELSKEGKRLIKIPKV